MKKFWLVKSEPDAYSWEQLKKDGKTVWDGVRNFQARNHLKEMKKGDEVLYYHSNEGKEVVGIARVIREYFADPTAKEGEWVSVELAPLKALENPVSLMRIKREPLLSEIALVKQGRLSVMSLKEEEYDRILEMGGMGH